MRRQFITLAAASVALAAALAGCGGAGSSGSTAQPIVPQAQATFVSDTAAATQATSYAYHVMPALSHKGVRAQSVVYPADLQYYGGPVLKTARLENVFVNSGSSQFGYPNAFEEHLSYSKFAHVTDQYVGATSQNRYDWEGDLKVAYPHYTVLADNDMLVIVHHAAALTHKSGYGHIFNVFLPQGTDVCFTGTNACNASSTSPNPAFCAYHASATFSDVGHVIFTVEPYQDPYYCAQPSNTPTPNGNNDYTYSTLSHELFESITDPDPPTSWVDNNVGVRGEIGDLCAYLPATISLDGKSYYIQREYSNKVHGCVDAP